VVAASATATNSGLLGGWVPFTLPVTGLPSSAGALFQVDVVPSSWRG
jgi:hypothetical protein